MNLSSATDPDLDAFQPSQRIDPWETNYAAIVPRFSGGLSALSSLLIIHVILRSRNRLTTIYHRIMMGLSVADILGSVSMALTSLPMPAQMPNEQDFGYYWAGTRLGNTQTCNAQGFFALFGIVTMFSYNVSLCVYYACAIAIAMKEETIIRKIEPFLHAIPVVLGLICSLPPLLVDMYNPAVGNVSWCFSQPYPTECAFEVDLECIRGLKPKGNVSVPLVLLISLSFLTIVASLLSVWFKVRKNESALTRMRRIYREHPAYRRIYIKHVDSKDVLVQSLWYIGAFSISLFPAGLRAVFFGGSKAHMNIGVTGTGSPPSIHLVRLDKAILVLLPLNGFFNFIIFMCHKIQIRRKLQPNMSVWTAFSGILFEKTINEPCFISRISRVEVRRPVFHNEDEEDEDEKVDTQENLVEWNVEDERGSHMRIQMAFGSNDSDNDNAMVMEYDNDHDCNSEDPLPSEGRSRFDPNMNIEISESVAFREDDDDPLISYPFSIKSITTSIDGTYSKASTNPSNLYSEGRANLVSMETETETGEGENSSERKTPSHVRKGDFVQSEL